MPRRIISEGGDAVRRISRGSLRMLGILGRIRPEERPEVRAAFLTLFGFMVGHALLETARDALFLARLPARQLPWVYLAIAVIAIAIGQREPRMVRRLSGSSELSRWLLGAAAVTLGFWTVASRPWPWVYQGLYVWTGVLATLVVVRFWTLIGSRFTLTQAKRLFPLIAAASVAGGITGTAIARLLTTWLPVQSLVFAAGVVFLLTARAPTGLADLRPEHAVTDRDDLPRLVRLIWGAPYLRRVAAMVLLATITFTLVDFVFKSTADRFIASDRLGAFFSTVYLGLNLASLVVQLGVAGWLVRQAGVMAAAALVPVVLLGATLGMAVMGGLGFALLMKGADGSLRHSIWRTTTELLFLPLSQRMRLRVKGFIDVLGQRGGQALASVLILMLLSTTTREQVFAGLAVATAAGWLAVAISLRPHWLNLFRETLHQDQRVEGPRSSTPALDVASLETLLATLNSPDDGRVIAALDLLAEQEKAAVVPTLLLYHPSAPVVVRTLELFQESGREDAAPVAARLTRHGDIEVRVAAIRTLAVLRPERAVLEPLAQDSEPAVALTAMVALLAAGWSERETTLERIGRYLDAGDPRLARTLALAIRAHPEPALELVVLRLLGHDDPEVVSAGIAAARALRTPRLVDPLLRLLPRRRVRDQVRVALAASGPSGVARMSEALADPEVPATVRRHIPSAMALVASARIPELLLRHLTRERDGLVRFRILRALGRWRTAQPELPLDGALLGDVLEGALATAYRLRGWRVALEAGATRHPRLRTELHEVLVALLADKQDHALERTFRLLNLRAGTDDFHRLYRGLHSPRDATRAGGRELLRALAPPQLRGHLLTLIDDLHGEISDPDVLDGDSARVAYESTLEALLESGMESVASLAAAHAGELGLRGLAPAVSRVTPLSSEHAGVLSAARDRLHGDPPEEVRR